MLAAQASLRAGELERAREQFLGVLHSTPHDADALFGLGTVLLQQGRVAEAAEHLRGAAQLLPAVPQIHFNLALAEERSGNARGAAASYRRAGRHAGSDAEMLARVSRKLAALEDWAGAHACLRQLTAARPGDADAHRRLATAAARVRDYATAIPAFERYLQLSADTATDRLAYADLLLMARRPAAAAVAVEQAMALGADGADAQLIAARCARLTGDYDAALARLRRATELRPGFGNAWWLRVELEREPEALETVAHTCRRLASEIDQRPRDRILLALTAGHALERLHRYEEAFPQFELGNREQRALLVEQGASYDAAAAEAEVAELIALFDRQPRPLGEPGSPGPIFVLGMPRSGTTLVERMLASLDGVEAGGENEAMEFVAARYRWERARGRMPDPAELSATELRTLADDYWHRTGGTPRLITDKLPHNFRHVGLIAHLFPHAPIIYLHRDPRDVAISIYARPFPDGHAYACDLNALGHFYALSERLHRHWRATMPDRVLDVQYEALVREPETQSRRMAEFCRLQWDSRCLAFHDQADASFTFSELQVREAINDRGVGRWRHYQRHLGPFVEALERAAPES